MLWLIAGAAIIVLGIGLKQEPANPFAAGSPGRRLWSPVEINPAQSRQILPGADLHALWYFDRDQALAAGESGTLLKTEDGGDESR